MEGKGKEGTWTGTGKEATDGESSEEGTTWEVLQSVRKEQPAGGNGAFGALG